MSDRNRHWVWRVMRWILLANVLLFWLMTCVTAFAQTTATQACVVFMCSPATGSDRHTQNATPDNGCLSAPPLNFDPLATVFRIP